MRYLSIALLLSMVPMLAAEVLLENTNWVATEVMGKAVTVVEGHPAVHMQLHSLDKKITGFSGCNRISGPYESSHEDLKLGPVVATRIACLEANVEPQFLEAISGTATFRIAGDELQLQNKVGKIIGRFHANGPVSPDSTKEVSK
jgi:heat shock protein HslJ